jgi:hypothetical protein
MRFLAVLLLVASGCKFHPGRYIDDGAVADDARRDGPGDGDVDSAMATVDADNCYRVAALSTTICLAGPLTGAIDVITDATVDTDETGTGQTDCKALAAGSSSICALTGNTFRIGPGATLDAEGDLPLVIIATTIQIEGTLDVASHRGAGTGPAANSTPCPNMAAATGVGGGFGGTFGGVGGDGGDEDGTNNGGTAGTMPAVTTLRGGCRGGAGGGGNSGADSGGAVLLIASSITLGTLGTINASGAGGQGGDSGREGGSGGGSGGMIVFVTPAISLGTSAAIFANGGHGGGGSDNSINAVDGTDPDGPASGGSQGIGTGGGGDGGPGFPAANRDGENGTGNDGAGGGGGGAGLIKVFGGATLSGAQVSPQPS